MCKSYWAITETWNLIHSLRLLSEFLIPQCVQAQVYCWMCSIADHGNTHCILLGTLIYNLPLYIKVNNILDLSKRKKLLYLWKNNPLFLLNRSSCHFKKKKKKKVENIILGKRKKSSGFLTLHVKKIPNLLAFIYRNG